MRPPGQGVADCRGGAQHSKTRAQVWDAAAIRRQGDLCPLEFSFALRLVALLQHASATREALKDDVCQTSVYSVVPPLCPPPVFEGWPGDAPAIPVSHPQPIPQYLPLPHSQPAPQTQPASQQHPPQQPSRPPLAPLPAGGMHTGLSSALDVGRGYENDAVLVRTRSTISFLADTASQSTYPSSPLRRQRSSSYSAASGPITEAPLPTTSLQFTSSSPPTSLTSLSPPTTPTTRRSTAFTPTKRSGTSS